MNFNLVIRLYFLFLIELCLGNQEVIYFMSANPFSFKDIIIDLDNLEQHEVHGFLTLPEGIKDNQRVPLVIGVAGSKGWSEHHLDYLEKYRQSGIATFELRSFKSRGLYNN